MAQHLTVSTAKVTPPRLGISLLSRPRLVEAVGRAGGNKLLILTAEAGYGKTSLLLSALPRLTGRVAWLTLDESDADLNLFAAAIAGALRHVAPGAGEAALRVLTTGPDEEDVRAAVLQCLEDLTAAETGELVLVLDDFQVLDGTRTALDLVDHLLRNLPPRVHLLIASRTRPDLKMLPRLRVEGQATIIGLQDLAFTPEEVRAFLRESHQIEIGSERAAHLAERTEGWPAALQLVALAARDRGDEALEGTPREIFDYLAAAVVDDLPPTMRQFLLRTSILSELTPGLCASVVAVAADPVAEIGDAGSVLQDLERRNLFVYRLDAEGTRYRYHQLFADFLQDRLKRDAREHFVALHLAAGRHLEAQGAVDRAVRHYFAAEAYDEAERLMKPYHGDRLTARLAYAFRDLVSRFPEELQSRYPWITRCGASSSRFVGDYHLGLILARRAMAAAEHSDPNLWAFSAHGVGMMYLHLDRFDDAITVCRQVLARLEDGSRDRLEDGFRDHVEPRMRVAVLDVLAESLIATGALREAELAVKEIAQAIDLEGPRPGKGLAAAWFAGATAFADLELGSALDQFRKAASESRERGSPAVEMFVATEMLRVAVWKGDLEQARTILGRAQELQAETGERSTDLELTTLKGDVAFLAGELDAAERRYHELLKRVRAAESQRPRVWAMLGLARVARARGQAIQAESRMRDSASIAERIGFGMALPFILFEQISLLRETGRSEAAREIHARLREMLAHRGSRLGLACCDFLEAELHRGAPGGVPSAAMRRRPATEAAEALDRALGEAESSAHDLLPFLRREADWSVSLLIEAVRRSIRPAVAGRLLGQIGDPRARRALQQLTRVSDPLVRDAAASALKSLPEPVAAPLALRLFGRFEAVRDGEPIPDVAWRTQKARALVKLLILQRTGMHQEALIEALWPESEPHAGAASLKTALKFARQALEPLREGAASRLLVRGGDMLRFAREHAWIDLEAYQELDRSARQAVEAGCPEEAITSLEEAARLYRGDLLEEDRYEEWAVAPRERFRDAQIDVLTRLAHLHEDRSATESAIQSLQRILDLDPLRESAYRELMRLALAHGDRPAALTTYQACERRLREGLGVAPQPETIRLAEEARRSA